MIGPDPGVMGGISAVAQYYLASSLVREVDLTYITSHRDGSKPFKLLVAVLGFGRFWWRLLTRRADIVHIHLSDKASFWRKCGFFFSAKSMGVPALFHLHGPEFHLFATRNATTRRWVRRALDRADLILVLAELWKERLAALTSNRKIETLYNPASLSPFPDEKPQRNLDAPCQLLFMGRLGERKGLPEIKTALEILMPRYPGLTATLAGDGEIDSTRAWAARFPWKDRVRIPGWLRGEDKWEAYRRADIFVLPSRNEGLPMAVLEGMAAGCAIVATPAGGTPEIMQEGVQGLFAPIGEPTALAGCIARLIDDPTLAARMGREGRRTVGEKFEIEAHVKMLLQHYAGLISDRARP